MKNIIFMAGLIMVALTGCKTINPLAEMTVAGNTNDVVIGNVWKWQDEQSIINLADKHCANYGKTASVKGTRKGQRLFACR